LPELALDGESDVAQARQDNRLDIPADVIGQKNAA